ncbi:hypothetical protein [Enterocloster clostridioformis]|nr:hypothetical protein [Enterocloster clostridioformis]
MKRGYEVICPDLLLCGMTEYYGTVVNRKMTDGRIPVSAGCF